MGRPRKNLEEQLNEDYSNQEESTGPNPENILADALKGKENQKHIVKVPEKPPYRISTGSLILDIATGGLPPGIHRLCGQNNCGKTPECLEIIANYLNVVPKSRGLFIDAEAKLNEENKSRTNLKFVYDPKDWKEGTVYVLTTNIYEIVANVLERLLVSEYDGVSKFCIGIDSNDALILKDDADKPLTQNMKMAGGALLSKRLLSRIGIYIPSGGHLLIFISQVSADIQADKYKQTTNAGNNYTGGNALLHWPTFIIEFNNELGKGKYILDDPNGRLNDGKTKQIGYECKVTLRKTTKENKDTTYHYPIKYKRKGGSGIWREREVAQLLQGFGFLTRESAKGSFVFEPNFAKELKENNIPHEEKIRSENGIYEMLENNSKLTNYCFNKLKETLGDSELGIKEENNEE